MPTYPYECKFCLYHFDIMKTVASIDDDEPCPECDSATDRLIARNQSFYGADQWDCVGYDPAFGQIIKDNSHRKRLAKEKGMIEIGNEPVDKMHRHFETQLDKDLDSNWDKV